MSILEICLVGLGLAADAFAVAMCKGVEMKKFILKYAVVIALFFGVFQAVMPLIGWAVASTFEKYITAYDHWIAFGLLLLLGGKMIWDSFKKEANEGKGLKIPSWMKIYVKYILPAVIIAIFIKGYWDIFSKL